MMMLCSGLWIWFSMKNKFAVSLKYSDLQESFDSMGLPRMGRWREARKSQLHIIFGDAIQHPVRTILRNDSCV